MLRLAAPLALLLLAGRATPAAADARCTDELTRREISWRPASRPGIADAVEIRGPLGGIEHHSHQPLVIDCSLAVSLDEAGRYLRDLGLARAGFSSAYSRRSIRGTRRPSKHSYGLAIDIHSVEGPDLGTLRIDRDYEQGLGDEVDCVGAPLTQAGALLKVLQCQLVRSGLFRVVLSPDFDDAHHDHLHLEVVPWSERPALRAPTAALH